MHIRHKFLLLLLPTILLAQSGPKSVPFLLTPPGIAVQMEKFQALTPPGVQITGCAWDQKGFLWCRTKTGLARFDGQEFTLYRVDYADTAGAFRADLRAIVVDGEGFIWGGTASGGLGRFDPSTARWRWYQGREEDSTSIGAGAPVLLVTSDGELWAAATYGLARYDRHTDSFVRHRLPPDYPRVREDVVPAGYVITSLCELGRSIWIGLIGGGLAEFNRETGLWRRYPHRMPTAVGPSDSIVRSLCPDQTGRLWIGTRNSGLNRHDPRTGTWDYFSVTTDGISVRKKGSAPVSSPPVWSIVEDDFGGIWIAALGAGIFRFDPASGTSILYRHDSTDANSLPSDLLLWLGPPRTGYGHGGERAPSGTRRSIIWIPPNVWGMAPSGIEGTHRAIVRKDPCTSIIIPTKEGRPQLIVSSLLPDSSGKIWVGLINGGVGSFDLARQTVTWYAPVPNAGVLRLGGLRDGTVLATTPLFFRASLLDRERKSFASLGTELRITSFLEENDTLLWLGCRSARGMSFLAAMNRKNGKCTVYPRQDRDSASHRDEIVTGMCRDGRGALWYGTEGGGLIRFDLAGKTYRRHAGHPGSENGLLGNNVGALIPDSTGKLWIGTNGGLVLMDCEQGTFEHLHSNLHEAAEPLIRDMVDDGEGRLWIAANEGALCFTKATRRFCRLPSPSHFHGSRFWSAMFDARTRSVGIGGTRGVFLFSLDDPPPASAPPPVVLTSFRVFDKPYPLEADVSSLKSITIPFTASFFSFTFAALDYLNPGMNRYAYCLEGFDREWVQAGSRRYASYTNLHPGTYRFRVRGANGDGVWNEEGAAIEIVILPPWYRSVWAYVGYILGIAGLFLLLRYLDRKRVALRHALQMQSFEAAKMREVDQMKSAFFANISHEFRTPLTLMLGPLEQLAERWKHDDSIQATISTMRRNGLRLLQLINELLDLSRMDAGKMKIQLRPIELVSLSRALVMAFQSMAERRRIGLIFDPEHDEITGYADREKFEKILTNLLSNAFKFTGDGGEIKVLLRPLPGPDERPDGSGSGALVELVVADTGVGIAADHLGKVFDRFYQVGAAGTEHQGGTGIGLALTKELVEILRGEITVTSAPGRGSTFTVRLPIGKEGWSPEEFAPEEAIPNPEATPAPATLLAAVHHAHPAEECREPGKPVVLIVEDNIDVRTYVRGFLEKHYTVEEAADGRAGLDKAREAGVDLVISDIMMPVMDGIQLCRELKQDDRTSHIPVILLTARATSEGKVDGLESGADDYVVKPFEARELTARVKNLIDIRKALWEKYHRQVTLGPAEIPVASVDERFLRKLAECLERHVADADYDTESLAHDLCMSRMQLNRKLNALTGKPTHEVVREFRLQRAAELLRKHAGNVSGVAYDVGFNSLSHFARAFRERFGVPPSEYASGNRAGVV